MAPSLTLPFLGFRHFRKLVQPLLIGHDRCLSHGGPASGATGPIKHCPGYGSVDLFPTGVQTVFFSVIGAWIIATGNAVAGSGTIVALAHGPVK